MWFEAVYSSLVSTGKRPRSDRSRSPARSLARRNLAFRSDDGRPPSNDDSGSRRNRDGGSDRSNGSSPRLDWDSAEVQLDAETFISTLASSKDIKDQQMAAFLKVRDAQVADLHKKLKAEQQRAATQELIHNFDEKGVSGWHFAKDDIVAYYRPRYSGGFRTVV